MKRKESKPAMIDRVLPNSIEAERAVLGAMILDPKAAGSAVCEQLREEAFYYAAHQVIFREAKSLIDSLQALDLVTLTQRIFDKGQLEEIGGAAALTDLVIQVPSTANVEQYIKIVEERHQRRQFVSLAYAINGAAVDPTRTIEEIQQEISLALGQIGVGKTRITPMKEAITGAMEQIEKVISSERHITGLSTGFRLLDELTFGLNPPDFWILAGRPGDGKTALACSIAANIANIEKVAVGIISLEQNNIALAKRLLASWSSTNMRKLRSISQVGMSSLMTAAEQLIKLPIYFDDRPALTAGEIRSTARMMHRQFGCRCFILDYLQLSRADEKSFSRNDEVAKISAMIKATAKELDSPFLVLSQLNRKAGESRPNLTSLRDSGAIEQDADVVVFINRDLEEQELPESWRGKFSERDREHLVQLDIAKQREGERDVAAFLRFDQEFTRFRMVEFREPDLPYSDPP